MSKLDNLLCRINLKLIYHSDKGYFADCKKRTATRRLGLVRYCGSTLAYNVKFLLSLDLGLQKLSTEYSKQEIIEKCDKFFIERIMGNHTALFQLTEEYNALIIPFPFFSSCWVLGTGNNIYQGRKKGITVFQ